MKISTAIFSSLFASVLLLSCQQKQAEVSETDTIETEQSQQQEDLYIETTSTRLKPSQIELGQIIQSEIESNSTDLGNSTQAGTTSQAESQQVAVSQAQIQQIMSDLDAQQTNEGLQINLPESILFDFDKYDLRADAQPTLEKLSQLINYYQDAPVSIAGHTDSKGSDSYNQQLSEKRANAVKNALVSQFSIDSSRLKAQGFGESKPITANTKSDGSDDPAGRQKNRRVEVVVKNKSIY